MNELKYVPEHPAPGELSSDAVRLGDSVWVTEIPVDESGLLAGTTIEEQSRAVIEALRTTLERAGSGLDLVAHLTIYLTDIQRDRSGFNDVYAATFPDPKPVRCAVGVSSLARPGMLVELTAVATVRA